MAAPMSLPSPQSKRLKSRKHRTYVYPMITSWGALKEEARRDSLPDSGTYSSSESKSPDVRRKKCHDRRKKKLDDCDYDQGYDTLNHKSKCKGLAAKLNGSYADFLHLTPPLNIPPRENFNLNSNKNCIYENWNVDHTSENEVSPEFLQSCTSHIKPPVEQSFPNMLKKQRKTPLEASFPKFSSISSRPDRLNQEVPFTIKVKTSQKVEDGYSHLPFYEKNPYHTDSDDNSPLTHIKVYSKAVPQEIPKHLCRSQTFVQEESSVRDGPRVRFSNEVTKVTNSNDNYVNLSSLDQRPYLRHNPDGYELSPRLQKKIGKLLTQDEVLAYRMKLQNIVHGSPECDDNGYGRNDVGKTAPELHNNGYGRNDVGKTAPELHNNGYGRNDVGKTAPELHNNGYGRNDVGKTAPELHNNGYVRNDVGKTAPECDDNGGGGNDVGKTAPELHNNGYGRNDVGKMTTAPEFEGTRRSKAPKKGLRECGDGAESSSLSHRGSNASIYSSGGNISKRVASKVNTDSPSRSMTRTAAPGGRGKDSPHRPWTSNNNISGDITVVRGSKQSANYMSNTIATDRKKRNTTPSKIAKPKPRAESEGRTLRTHISRYTASVAPSGPRAPVPLTRYSLKQSTKEFNDSTESLNSILSEVTDTLLPDSPSGISDASSGVTSSCVTSKLKAHTGHLPQPQMPAITNLGSALLPRKTEPTKIRSNIPAFTGRNKKTAPIFNVKIIPKNDERNIPNKNIPVFNISPTSNPVNKNIASCPVTFKATSASRQNSNSQSGVTSPQSGVTSPQSGVTSPQSGVTSPQSGVMSPQSGVMSPQSGVMSPQSGVMSPQSVVMSPQSGVMSPKSGVMSPKSGMMSPQSGMMSPQSGVMSPQSGVVSPQPGVTSPQFIKNALPSTLTADSGFGSSLEDKPKTSFTSLASKETSEESLNKSFVDESDKWLREKKNRMKTVCKFERGVNLKMASGTVPKAIVPLVKKEHIVTKLESKKKEETSAKKNESSAKKDESAAKTNESSAKREASPITYRTARQKFAAYDRNKHPLTITGKNNKPQHSKISRPTSFLKAPILVSSVDSFEISKPVSKKLEYTETGGNAAEDHFSADVLMVSSVESQLPEGTPPQSPECSPISQIEQPTKTSLQMNTKNLTLNLSPTIEGIASPTSTIDSKSPNPQFSSTQLLQSSPDLYSPESQRSQSDDLFSPESQRSYEVIDSPTAGEDFLLRPLSFMSIGSVSPNNGSTANKNNEEGSHFENKTPADYYKFTVFSNSFNASMDEKDSPTKLESQTLTNGNINDDSLLETNDDVNDNETKDFATSTQRLDTISPTTIIKNICNDYSRESNNIFDDSFGDSVPRGNETSNEQKQAMDLIPANDSIFTHINNISMMSTASSEGKKNNTDMDFLIDDEISDQPGLTFADEERRPGSASSNRSSVHNSLLHAMMMSTSDELGFSPPLTEGGSIAHHRPLSVCTSLGEEDCMLDFDDNGCMTPTSTTGPASLRSLTSLRGTSQHSSPHHSLIHHEKRTTRPRPNEVKPTRLPRLLPTQQSQEDSAVIDKLLQQELLSNCQDTKSMLLKLRSLILNTDDSVPYLPDSKSPDEDRTTPVNDTKMSEAEELRQQNVDLKRQVFLLQQQLSEKTRVVSGLEQRLTESTDSISFSNSESQCDAATQTDRSSRVSSLGPVMTHDNYGPTVSSNSFKNGESTRSRRRSPSLHSPKTNGKVTTNGHHREKSCHSGLTNGNHSGLTNGHHNGVSNGHHSGGSNGLTNGTQNGDFKPVAKSFLERKSFYSKRIPTSVNKSC